MKIKNLITTHVSAYRNLQFYTPDVTSAHENTQYKQCILFSIRNMQITFLKSLRDYDDKLWIFLYGSSWITFKHIAYSCRLHPRNYSHRKGLWPILYSRYLLISSRSGRELFTTRVFLVASVRLFIYFPRPRSCYNIISLSNTTILNKWEYLSWKFV